MSKSNAAETDLLKLIFNNTTWTGVGDATGIVGSGTAGSLFVALHTADPGEAGTQTTSEISYTGYARQPVARTSGAWTITGNSVSPNSTITFGQMTAGAGGTVTHFSVGTAVSGTGEIIYSGTVTPNISVTTNVIPQIQASGTAITED